MGDLSANLHESESWRMWPTTVSGRPGFMSSIRVVRWLSPTEYEVVLQPYLVPLPGGRSMLLLTFK